MSNSVSPNCRTCGSTNTKFVGRSPRARWFAGVKLRTQLHGGALFRCTGCHLLQRSPILSDAEYVKLYEGSGDFWPQSTLRPDQLKVRDHILRSLPRGGGVLDIGCAAGALLLSLGPDYEKFGVEPAAEPAAKAGLSGVTIVADSVGTLEHRGELYDLICAVDVIEHVADPLSFLRQLIPHLKPGGELVISTGNSDSLVWRWVGPSYYYAYCYEHISFISPAWCQFAQKQGIHHEIVEANFRHEIAGQNRMYLARWLKFAIKLAIHWVERRFLMLFPGAAKRLGPRLVVGEPGLFADHFLVTFKANGARGPI
jgi:SAM-dependent methyltransferase